MGSNIKIVFPDFLIDETLDCPMVGVLLRKGGRPHAWLVVNPNHYMHLDQNLRMLLWAATMDGLSKPRPPSATVHDLSRVRAAREEIERVVDLHKLTTAELLEHVAAGAKYSQEYQRRAREILKGRRT